MPRELQRYRVLGMDCAEEVAALKRALAGVVDPEEVRFDLLEGTMEVPISVSAKHVAEGARRAGLRAQPVSSEPARDPAMTISRAPSTISATVSLIGLVGGFMAHVVADGIRGAAGIDTTQGHAHGAPALAIAGYAVAIVAGMLLVAPKAWSAARSLRLDMNVLMTLAVAGAIGIGEWFEAATVSFLFALSLTLESWSMARARRAVEALLSLAPPQVRVRRDGILTSVDPATVAVGTVFVVQPGERIGLDGRVVAGSSDVDQAPITGESGRVPKDPGDDVYAGTINGNGALDVESTRPAAETTLAQIIRLVGEARTERSDAEMWVERFARVYTPAVFASAVVLAVVPPLVGWGEWSEWFYRGLVLLVIGCPCALVIATPVAVVAGLAAAASHGVLVKGGRFLEAPASLRVVALDKTGTVTEGQPRVTDVAPIDGHTPEELLRAAASIESHSPHPIARAIVERARVLGVRFPEPTDVQNVPGKGNTGAVAGRRYWVGSHRWLEERGQERPEVHAELAERSDAGHSVVVVGTDDHVCGYITLADAVRPDAREAIEGMYRAGIQKVALLTGDNAATAEKVAADVGIRDVRAELLPADKVVAVAELEREFGAVAMVGDGVNDAPALARATVGVAMGAIGTDAAVETADVALMADDLGKLTWLLRLSRRTVRVIRQNTIAALGIKALFVILTFAGAASLWSAIAADMGASLLVVLNALRLLRGV